MSADHPKENNRDSDVESVATTNNPRRITTTSKVTPNSNKRSRNEHEEDFLQDQQDELIKHVENNVNIFSRTTSLCSLQCVTKV